jgi:REP element-mobilizing transposase RayT
MTQPRRDHVSPNQAGTYHCVARCVRRSWLFGFDAYANRDFDHRKHWIPKRIKELSEIFACSVLSYAVMSNHFHLVAAMQPAIANAWTDREVAERWCKLYPKQNQLEHMAKIETLLANEALLKTYRGYLSNLSWLMKSIVEPIARRANAEDKVSGRFWEGRFKSQLLMSEKSILAAMAYVDLNPIRADIAKRLRSSKHTSIRERCIDIEGRPVAAQQTLRPLIGYQSHNTPTLTQGDYIKIVDYTGRQLAKGKKGFIRADEKKAFDKLGLNPDHWVHRVKAFGPDFGARCPTCQPPRSAFALPFYK